MDPEEAAYLLKLREDRKKNKKPSTKAVRQLSCEPILVPSEFAVPYKSSKCCKSNLKEISQSSFSGDARNGILLDKPGVYRLKENINFKPTVERTTGITITASNVVLDFGTFTLAQKNDMRYTYGIAIARDVHNVTITGVQNQSIVLDFSLAGVRVMGGTDTITIENITTSRTTISQLVNDDIAPTCEDQICNYMNAGIVVGEGDTADITMQGTDRTNLVTNLVIRGITAKRSVLGCHVVFTFGIEITDSLFTENTQYGLVFGELFLNFIEPGVRAFPICGNGVVRNCRFDSNRADNFDLSNPADLFWYDFLSGIALFNCQNFLVEQCTICDNYQTGLIYGVVHGGSEQIVWKDCFVARNRGEFASCDGWHASGSSPNILGAFCYGLEFPIDQNVNMTIENVTSVGNSAGGASRCTGMALFFCSGVKMTDCHTSGNRGTVIGAGIYVDGRTSEGYSEEISISSCTAENNNLELPFGSATATVAGLFINSTSKNIVVRDFLAQGNGSLGNSPVAGGIVVFNRSLASADALSNVVIDNSILNNNGNGQARFSGGIVVRRRAGGVPLDNVLIQNNTLTNNLGAGVGIYGEINKVVIKANEADNNTGIGFDVSQVPNPVLTTMNIAYNPH